MKFDEEEERQYLNKTESTLRKLRVRLSDLEDEKYYVED